MTQINTPLISHVRQMII